MCKNRAMTHRIVVLALDGVVAFDLGIASRIFTSATLAAGEPIYETLTCTVDGGPVRTTAGFSLLPDHGPEVLAEADTVVIPGPYDGELLDSTTLSPELSAALALIPKGARYVSICTGAFVLAAAGLLDGRPATTHWMQAERFRALYPQVDLDPDVLFVDDGDVLSSAGAAAGIDLCLHIVRRDHGSEIANHAARRVVVPAWRDGGQRQYIERPLPTVTDASTTSTRQWMAEHLQEALDLRQLAANARMSVRTFTRRFREETGMSPGQWLLHQRVERARHLLEHTDLSVERIAREAGFGTAASLRQHLNAVIGAAPSAYRRTFRSA